MNEKEFEMRSRFFNLQPPVLFTESSAPDWLTGEKTIKGSTHDCRWFWNDHVLTLEVGTNVDTDFQTIKRIK